MRRAILLVCLFALPGVAQGQVAPIYGPAGDPYYRGPVFVGPPYSTYYGHGGNRVQSLPGTAPRGDYFRTATGGNFSNNRLDWRGTRPMRRQAGYFYYPNYPELMNPNRPDIRPDSYVLPPPPITPYHDPYFEERIWYDDWDNYDYWGW